MSFQHAAGKASGITPGARPAPTSSIAALAAANTELATAVRVAQRMLAAYGDPSGWDIGRYAQAHGALAESLRILLRALDVDPGEDEKGTQIVSTPGGDQPRCPAAHPDSVTPDSLPAPVTDLLAAIAEALDLPLPSTELADEQAHHVLLRLRVSHVRILLEAMLDHPHVPIDQDAADVRTHIEKNPVAYTTYNEQKAKAETRGEQ